MFTKWNDKQPFLFPEMPQLYHIYGRSGPLNCFDKRQLIKRSMLVSVHYQFPEIFTICRSRYTVRASMDFRRIQNHARTEH